MSEPTSDQNPIFPVVRAIVLLVISACLFIVATPGIDGMNHKHLRSAQDVDKAKAQFPAVLVDVGKLVMDFERQVRAPIVRKLNVFERPLRLKQTWSLYGDGPTWVRRLEVWADNQIVYRTGDPQYEWMASVLDSRRIRPVVESVAKKTTPRNRKGLGRLIIRQARADFPEVELVEIWAVRGRFPGTNSKRHHGQRAAAPDWKLEDI